ncbi:hypothetical protein SAMN04487848_2286 [Microbacterium sp. ru370.1]|nr:hypothetical protein SAMN04487848_2286 [Microbacterium sp. ru370.1]SIT89913.1 hypothetical protein SAMN05880579_2281 [Microbacterium sp. RU1D]
MNTSVAETGRWSPVSRTGALRVGALAAQALSAAIHRDTPPPTVDDLDARAGSAWAIEVGLLEPVFGDEESSADIGVSSHDFWLEPWPSAGHAQADEGSAGREAGTRTPTTPRSENSSDPRDVADARLRSLEAASVERRRHTAEEYRLIAMVLRDAAVAPEPWVGADPALDAAWADGRRRRIAAVRREAFTPGSRGRGRSAALLKLGASSRSGSDTVRRAELAQTRCVEQNWLRQGVPSRTGSDRACRAELAQAGRAERNPAQTR